MNQTDTTQFLPTTLVDWVSIAAGIATVIVIIFLYLQMRSTDQSNRLAYGPLVIPKRTITQGGYFVLNLVNIGNGAAKDIMYIVFDLTNAKDLVRDKTIPFIRAGDSKSLPIVWQQDRRIAVHLRYQDVIGNEHTFSDTLDY